MPDIENGQHWLDRNRPPRVQITYDVEIGDAVQKKELPLVVGIFANLDGKEDKVVADQAFREIDGGNFDEIMKDIAPTVTVNLPASAHLKDEDGGKAFAATFTFEKFADFDPVALLKMDGTLRELYEERGRLRDMLARLDGNVRLEDRLGSAFSAARGKPGEKEEATGGGDAGGGDAGGGDAAETS